MVFSMYKNFDKISCIVYKLNICIYYHFVSNSMYFNKIAGAFVDDEVTHIEGEVDRSLPPPI